MIIQNEYCDGGCLAEQICDKLRCGLVFTETELCVITLHVALGLAAMNSQDLVHLDIKPGNIFIKSAVNSGQIYKIGDLGHVTKISDPRSACTPTLSHTFHTAKLSPHYTPRTR